MELTIYTYGGTGIAESVLNAVAMLMNSKTGSLYQPLMFMTASIGGAWATAKALFNPSFQTYIGQYFLPMVALVSVLMVPSMTVRIEDKLIEGDVARVDHVPFLLAKVAGMVSTTGHYLTRAMEKVMHTPNDVNYNSTGMIFGAQTSMEISNYQITNANLDKNLRKFCKQCVLYDIHLGLYNQDELMKTTDLFSFLEEKTSKVRLIDYYDPSKGNERNLKSCKDAMKTMKQEFSEEIEYYSNHNLLKHLPSVYESLTGMAAESKNIISQQLMMNTFRKEYTGEGFAKSRSRMQQRSTYRILGGLAANSLVAMRSVFEVLIYASFIFVMPMMMLPGGVGFFGKWAFLLVWIQMWPPFFVILDYIMQSIAQGQSSSIFHGLAQNEAGLSLFTSIGLTYLQEDIYALAGYLSASIPFISYALVQGGAGSFVHLAGAMMTPAHTAAAAAASEQVTGNYSYGNTNWGNTQFENATTNQRNVAASMTGGYMRYDNGMSSHTQTFEGDLQTINSSSGRDMFQGISQIQHSISRAKADAYSRQETASENLSHNLQAGSKTLIDGISTLSNSSSVNGGISENTSSQVSEAAKKLQAMNDTISDAYNVDSKVVNEIAFGVKAGYKSGFIAKVITGASLEGHMDASRRSTGSWNDIVSDIETLVSGEDYQSCFQTVADYGKFNRYTESSENGDRDSLSINECVDRVRVNAQSLQEANSHLERIEKIESLVKNNSEGVTRTYNQEFSDFAAKEYENIGGLSRAMQVMKRPDGDPEKEAINKKFLEKFFQDSNIFAETFEFKNSDFQSRQEKQLDESKSRLESIRQMDNYTEMSNDLMKAHKAEERKRIMQMSQEKLTLDHGYSKSKSKVSSRLEEFRDEARIKELKMSNSLQSREQKSGIIGAGASFIGLGKGKEKNYSERSSINFKNKNPLFGG
ncbi:MAG: hypothetical protein CMO81_00115 [Waddliaceae bacterium]|nr:hypothetical protein [Waddliaceae bacterium]